MLSFVGLAAFSKAGFYFALDHETIPSAGYFLIALSLSVHSNIKPDNAS